MRIVVGLLLATLVLASISLQRAYVHMPLRELKRRAREGDQLAELLHRAAAYGQSLQAVLWVLIGLTMAGFFVYIARSMPAWVAVVLSAGLIWFGFGRLSRSQAGRISLGLGRVAAPLLAWVLLYLHPLINWFSELAHRYWPIHVHTGLYGKEDLLDLINSQNIQPDSRIEEHDLELAFHALTFGEKKVEEYMTPRRMVKTVSIDDDIGPLLMDELHGTGFSRFPVFEGKKDNIIGTLFLKDLVKTKGSSKVRDVMRREVCYVHEDQSLHDALAAILKTRHHLLIVVNSFEEYVGVISIEDIFEQIVGRSIQDEFDQYDDLRAVAARAAKKEHAAHEEVATTVPTDDEVVE